MTTPEERAIAAAQAQLDAYNAHDVEAFVSCYSQDVVLYNLRSGEEQGRGRDHLREQYAALFARSPELHATVTHRQVVGNVAFDREHVTGLRAAAVDAMAIYEVDEDGLICKVWFVVA